MTFDAVQISTFFVSKKARVGKESDFNFQAYQDWAFFRTKLCWDRIKTVQGLYSPLSNESFSEDRSRKAWLSFEPGAFGFIVRCSTT